MQGRGTGLFFDELLQVLEGGFILLQLVLGTGALIERLGEAVEIMDRTRHGGDIDQGGVLGHPVRRDHEDCLGARQALTKVDPGAGIGGVFDGVHRAAVTKENDLGRREFVRVTDRHFTAGHYFELSVEAPGSFADDVQTKFRLDKVVYRIIVQS